MDQIESQRSAAAARPRLSLPAEVLRNGSPTPSPAPVALRAGPLRLIFDPAEGDLRHIQLGGREVVRRISVALRDERWRTPLPTIADLTIDDRGDHFRIGFSARHVLDAVDYLWRGSIVGEPDGRIVYTMDGEARSTFRRSRIGICVLHPIEECAGQPCRMEHADGSVEQGEFPRYVEPHQPFFQIRAIEHEAIPGCSLAVRFEGEVFEMEDHRNWTDASFKTYSTPLELPKPVLVEAGTRLHQTVTLTLRGQLPDESAALRGAEPVQVRVGAEPLARLPKIGLGVADEGPPLSGRQVERLRGLGLSYLRIDLHLAAEGREARLARAADEARALSVPLEAAVFVTDAAAAELTALRAKIERLGVAVWTWLVFHEAEMASSSDRWVRLARERLGNLTPAARFGTGTDWFFAQLNRARPSPEALASLDVVAYSINPQMHAFDDLSLIENLVGQAMTVKTARQFVGSTQLAVSPVTFKQRRAVHGHSPVPAFELPPTVDPRQASLFGAGWTLGSLKYLAESGVSSVTYYETHGPRGLLADEVDAPPPTLFPALAGGAYPLYHVFADLAPFRDGEVCAAESSESLAVVALALQQGGQRRLLVANVSRREQRVEVQGVEGRIRLWRLDGSSAERAVFEPEVFRAEPGEPLATENGARALSLAPYAVVRLDWEQ